MRRPNFLIKDGRNPISTGLAAIAARVESGRLKILKGRCPNLLREAELYRYPARSGAGDEEGPTGEKPIDANNHALAALRYLIARLDHRTMALPPARSA